jgi:hypothetical protein
MKNLQKTTFIVIILILLISCEKKITEIEYEKNVLTEIFPKIVDSICVDSRKMIPPPKYGIETWEKGQIIKVDTSKVTEKERIEYQNWKKEQNRIEKDTSKIIIGFDPFLLKFGEERNYEKVNLYNSKYSNFRFDYSKIQLNRKFKIKDITEFPKAEKLLLYEQKYDFVFSGFLEISRIKFDKNRKSGVLEASFSYCGKCGRGYRIFIKEINGEWKIEKLEDTWIS